MTRVSEFQLQRRMLDRIQTNRTDVNKLGDQIASGIKVSLPGDSNIAGTISQSQEAERRIDSHLTRISAIQGSLEFQDSLMGQANELLIRAKELASQAANESNSSEVRAQMAAEVWELRDHMVSLANSKYQGRYIYGGADDDDPPYDPATYTAPATGSASQRYVFDAETGTSTQRTVAITDDLSITVNTQGNTLFDNSIQGLERLGRALSGYATLPTSGAPDGTGAAYNLPTEYSIQTDDIQNAIDLMETSRTQNIIPQQTTLGGRLRRLETAQSILRSSKQSIQDVLSKIQTTDVADAASQLANAQTALQASLTVSTKLLNQSILDYL